MDVHGHGRVISFREWPQLEGWINVGFVLMSQGDFDCLAPDCFFEDEPKNQQVKVGALSAHRHREFWQPLDTKREATYLNSLWEPGQAPWQLW